MPDEHARQSEIAGSRIIETERARIDLVEPWRAGQYDPPMQEWLQLPVADSCPDDATHKEWGTSNARGYFLVRRCHTCRAMFRPEVTPHMISDVVAALTGMPRRFIKEYIDR